MKVDFINSSYRRFFKAHKKEIVDAFVKCASKGDFMLRDETRKFEKNLAQYIGTKYAVAVNSGTDAIFLSLKALGIGPGDEVITVSHTFIATIQAIVHTGAVPILVDVGEDELMDMEQVRQKITDKTKVIIPVHYHGKVCDMEELFYIIQAYDLFVVEDSAQALGANRINKMAGSYGDTGCFSFNFPKLMGAYGDCGAITTDDEEIYKKLLLLRNHWNITQGSVDSDKYPQPDEMGWGYKSRMDNIQAAILNVKFKYLDEMLKRRKEIARMYQKGFEQLPIKLPIMSSGDVVQEYIIRVENRDEFVEFMKKKEIELLVRDTVPNHKLKGLGLEHYGLPLTEEFAKTSVRLPCYNSLTNTEVQYIIKSVKEFFKNDIRTSSRNSFKKEIKR